MEDKAMLSFIKDYRRLHKGESGNVPSGFNQTHILPHILSEGEHSIRQPAFLSSSSLGRPSSSGVGVLLLTNRLLPPSNTCFLTGSRRFI